MDAARRLKGEVALVTGAGRGIGRAVAIALAREGARVGLMSRTAEELREVARTVREAGGEARELCGDVLVPEDVERAVAELAGQEGGLTILVNNAGTGRSAPFAKTSRALWDEMLALNATSAFAVTQAALPHMLAAGHGRIVSVASIAGIKGYAYISAYCASKHALVGLTRALAVELAAKKITVNAVCPGYVDSAMTDRNLAVMSEKTKRPVEELRREIEALTPQHRLFTPEEVAATVLHLCLPEARGITGQAIAVCGGEMPV
ncbi:MAG: SDR family oxidoreductase [Candidatus Brocadiae bacterium]|nr:SDR family oxidoreductase [Candidatus Brocadiia bacterium]